MAQEPVLRKQDENRRGPGEARPAPRARPPRGHEPDARPPGPPRIVVLTGRANHRSVPITRSVTIGRDPDACELALQAPDVARRHVRLIPVEDGVAVRDLRTRAGTFRNGRRLVTPELLEDGDVITVGDVDLRFDVDSRRPLRRPRPEPSDTRRSPPPATGGRLPGSAPGVPPSEGLRAGLAEALRVALADEGPASHATVPGRAVLLCHDPADRDVADLLVGYLQRRGHAVWIDRSTAEVEDGWRGRLIDVAWSSDGALFLVSPASATSERARREVHLAGAERLPVVPVVIGATELEPDLAWYLTEREPIDLRDDPMTGLAALATAIEALPARRLARPRRLVAGLVVAAVLVVVLVIGVRAVLG